MGEWYTALWPAVHVSKIESECVYRPCIVDRDLQVGIYIVIMVIRLFMIMRPVSGASVVFKVARQALQHSF